jgi:hypothetical protein
VAGNSGPLSQETSWPAVAREINAIRARNRLAPIVAGAAIADFEDAVRACSNDYPIPGGSDGLDQHAWSESQRKTYQLALSELNRAALETLPASTIAELKKLFELTTVTRKLRRIASLDRDDLARSCRQARPAWIALTFMNYVFPQNWFKAPVTLSADEQDYIRWVEEVCDAPVGILSYGPEDGHIVSTGLGR